VVCRRGGTHSPQALLSCTGEEEYRGLLINGKRGCKNGGNKEAGVEGDPVLLRILSGQGEGLLREDFTSRSVRYFFHLVGEKK